MFDLNKSKDLKIFMIGIGGISMSALAMIFQHMGHVILGSDSTESLQTKHLRENGISVFTPHDANNVTNKIDLVITSSAISADNAELSRAKELKIPIILRSQALGMLAKKYQNTISVAGSHGKTTTTAMLSEIFIDAGLDPTVHIGATFDKIGGNVRIGKSNFFITEACEYCDSFLTLKSKVSVVLNVQADHLDYFKNIHNLQKSFEKYAKNTKKGGLFVKFGDDKKSSEINSFAPSLSFGFKGHNDLQAKNIQCGPAGFYSFDCCQNKKCFGRVELAVPGKHNILNALAAVTVALHFKIPFSSVASSLNKFKGADRRFQFVKQVNGVNIFNDYAHHSTEIKAAIKAARELNAKRVIVVFQPHTYTRTKSFFSSFAKSLSLADVSLLYPIYSAREAALPGISSEALTERIKSLGGKSECVDDFEKIKLRALALANKGDIILILGAGNIVEVCDYF